MIKKIFTLRDKASEMYLPPFFEHTNGSAIRAIQDNMKQQDSHLNIHKEDLSLYCLGDYDDSIGQIDPLIPSACIGKLVDLDPTKETPNKG